MLTAALSAIDLDITPTDATTALQGSKHHAWLIQGVTEKGERFRPSDWAERLSSLMASFNGGRLQYSPLLHPLEFNGVKCVHLDSKLESAAPAMYKQVMEFARNNQLNIVESLF